MNKFILDGRISYIDIKCNENTGNFLGQFQLSQKKKDGTYSNFYIKVFRDTAEAVLNTYNEGDYLKAEGFISINKFTPKEGGKDIYRVELIANKLTPMEWVDNEKGKKVLVEKSTTIISDEDILF